MKTELMKAVNAYLAAEELQKERMPYKTALAVVQLKRAVTGEVTFYLERERELAMEYAQTDEAGEMKLSKEGTFLFREPGKAAEYAARREELGRTETQVEWTARRVPPPEDVSPAALEALDGFLMFEEGEEGKE